MRRPAGLACAVFVLWTAAPLAQEREPPPHDAVIQSLVDETSAAPPEFGADALIRLSASPRVTDDWRRELLEDAFFRAYGARQQYRLTSGAPISPDTRQGANLLASSTALTRVSLQVRATRLLAFVDFRRATDLFEWIDLNLEPSRCENPLVPDVEEYYAELSALARTIARSNRGAGILYLELYLWRAHLPSEMPSVARAMQRFLPKLDEAVYLEGLYRALLDTSTSDPRSFSAAGADIVSRTADLQIADRALGLRTWFQMETLRAYLAAQLKAPRCSDSTTESAIPANFNGALGRVHAGLDVASFDPNAVLPVPLRNAAVNDPYWQTDDARALYVAAAALRGPGVAPVSIRVRQTIDWTNQAERLLSDVERWAGRREPAYSDFVYEKAVIYTALLDLMPPSPARVRMIHSYVDFLRFVEVEQAGRTLWFAFVTRLLEAARAGDRSLVLSALEDTHEPVLSLYARMERLLPTMR
jgi:hypothetical protein